MRVFKTIVVFLFMMIMTFTYANAGVKTVFWNVFDAKVSNNSVELTWVVTEYNNKTFMIEHSTNGTTWENVALIFSKNSPESLEGYSFVHRNAGEGKHFYRVKHTDIDAKGTGYSPTRIVTIKQQEKQSAIVGPNPASDQLRIANNGTKENLYTRAMVFDLAGKMMVEQKLQAGNNVVSINTLVAGIYLVRIENKEGTAYTQKIIKQ